MRWDYDDCLENLGLVVEVGLTYPRLPSAERVSHW